MAHYIIDEIQSNPNARVLIVFPDKSVVSSFIKAEFAVGNTSEYEDPSTNSKSALVDKLSNAGMKLTGVGSEGGQVSWKQPSTTALNWTGSTNPELNLSLVFISTKSSDNVLNIAKKLHTLTYPSLGSSGLVYRAPLQYTPSTKIGRQPTAKGTVAIQIGKWFYAVGLVCLSFTPTYSKETIANGTPLYMECELTFRPFRQWTYEDIDKCYKR